MFIRHASISSSENIPSSTQTKETNIINNNLNSYNRTFGRELTNIQLNETHKEQKFIPTKPLNAGINRHGSLHTIKPMFMNTENNFFVPKEEPMMIEIPKTSRDPLFLPHVNQAIFEAYDKRNKESIIDTSSIQQNNKVISDLEPCDAEDLTNPQFTSVYNKEIFNHLKSIEEKFVAKPGYITKNQTDINEKMRAILIDWLVDVHLKFKLLPETLFLTVNLIDRYLEKVPVMRQKLQLVGVAALLISCKYEEIYSPEVKDFVIVTDKAYNREEILDMEGKILCAMLFNITVPSSLRFMERYSRVGKLDEKSNLFCRYILELCLVEYKMLKYTPSMLASAAVYINNKSNKIDEWTDTMVRNTKFEESSVKSCAKEIQAILQNSEKSSLTAVRRKYSSTKMMEVARTKIDF